MVESMSISFAAPLAGCVNVVRCNWRDGPPSWGMIRPQISNAVVMSVLFAALAGGATLLIDGGPALHRAAGIQRCAAPGLVFQAAGD
ncbi:hypothetical protein ACNHKD_00870 [Methylocystis sp. JAN1]|uniref:hypothetical protein n=1 Tax=Methylocystis sp. JAN1 TaxID=3397211 RepID=UPI003FA1B899